MWRCKVGVLLCLFLTNTVVIGQDKKLKKAFSKSYKQLAKQKFYKAEKALKPLMKKGDTLQWSALDKTEYYTAQLLTQYQIGNGQYTKEVLHSALRCFNALPSDVDLDEKIRLKKGILGVAYASGYYKSVSGLVAINPFDANTYNLAFPPSVSAELLRFFILTEQGYLFRPDESLSALAEAQLALEKALADKAFMKGIGKQDLLELEDNYGRMALLQIRILTLNGEQKRALDAADKQEENLFRILGKGTKWLARLCAQIRDLHLSMGDKKAALKWAERAVNVLSKNLEDYNAELVFEQLTLAKLYFELNKASAGERLGVDIQKAVEYYKNASKSNTTVTKYLVSFEKSRYVKDFRNAKRQADALLQFVSGDFEVSKAVIQEIRYMEQYFLSIGDYDAALIAANRYGKAHEDNFFDTAPGKREGEVEIALLKLKYLYQQAPEYLVSEKALNQLAQDFNKQHPLYLQTIELCFFQTLFLNELAEAEKFAKEWLFIRERLGGKYNQQYLEGLYNLAKVYIVGGKINQLSELVETFKEIESETKKANKTEANDIYLGYMEGSLYELLGDYNRAQKSFGKAFKKLNKSDKQQKLFVNIDPEVRASVHVFLGEYDEANKILEKALNKKTERFGEKAFPLVNTYLSLAKLRMQEGNLPAAKKMVGLAEEILLEQGSDKNIQLLQAMELQANMDIVLGDREMAYSKLVQLHDKEVEVYGAKHFKPAISNIKKTWMEFFIRPDLNRQIATVNKSLEIIAQELGANHPDYAFGMWMKAGLLLEQKEFAAALVCADSSLLVYEDIDPFHEMIVRLGSLKGDIYFSWGKISEAEKEYGIASRKGRRIYSDLHPALADLSFKEASTRIINGDEKGLKQLEEVMAAREVFLTKDFLFLTQREKQKYFAAISKELQYYPYVKITTDKSSSSLKDLITHRMRTKGVLLKSKTDFEGEILKTGNPTLVGKLDEWHAAQKNYTSALMGSGSADEAAQDIESLLRNAERLENEMLQIANDEKKKDKTDASDIQKSLEKDEALVEIVRCINEKFEPYYFAVVMSHKSISVCAIPNAKDLELKHYRFMQRSLEFEAKDVKSYDRYWAPIDSLLDDGIKKIYFSPDGIFHLVNPDMFRAKGDSTYLVDRVQILRLSNPKDAIKHKAKETVLGRSLSSMVIGNPKFSKTNNGKISDLKGAEKEVNAISASMNGKGWNATLVSNEFATEDTLLNSPSPNVLHIATHGFFKGSDVTEESDLGIRSLSGGNNPLINSGLLLASGGDSYDADAPINGNAEGIFTALEAQNLDLSSCELVVLSACETGLGSVSIGNGVFGLQKSFLDAGAGNILMTLQKVDDEVTQLLMNTFYDHYLNGSSAEDALYAAKLEVKKTHQHPHFWAPFILIK
jgi:CHAT domain-containing protein